MVTTVQSGDCEANGIRIHYTRTGGDKPAIVLAHGVTDDGLCWMPVAEALAPAYDVIMVDARGHGRSEVTDDGYDPATQAADLHGVIEALRLQKPVLLGHSMGAMTALAFAGIYPNTPRAILLEDPPPFWADRPEQESDRSRQRNGQARIAELKSKSREELTQLAREQHPFWSDAEIDPWVDAKLRVSPKVAGIFVRGRWPVVDWPAALRCVTCPTLVITADTEQGALLTPEGVASLQALVPQLEVANTAGAGHSIHREQFGAYSDVVSGFLEEVAATA